MSIHTGTLEPLLTSPPSNLTPLLGADVFILYLNEHEDAAATRKMVEAEGRRCSTMAGDVRDPKARNSSCGGCVCDHQWECDVSTPAFIPCFESWRLHTTAPTPRPVTPSFVPLLLLRTRLRSPLLLRSCSAHAHACAHIRAPRPLRCTGLCRGSGALREGAGTSGHSGACAIAWAGGCVAVRRPVITTTTHPPAR